MTMGMAMRSHHHHLTAILSPIHTGSHMRTMRLLTLPLYISFAVLKNIKDKLKAHMSKHHKHGDASTNLGYYTYWKRLLAFVIIQLAAFWNNTRTNLSQKRNVMKFKTGTLYTQKIARLYGRTASSSCLLSQNGVISQTAKSICSLVVRMLQFKTW